MDERHSKIKEGAGLDESRLNTDFLDFINKWGPRLLLVFIVIMGLYLGRNYLKDQKIQRVSEAFRDYNEVHLAGTPPTMLIRDIGLDGDAAPDSILEVARQHRSIARVARLAELRAADAAMAVVRRGVEPGATLTPEGTVEDPADLLSDDRIAELLDQAASLYQTVLDATKDDEAQVLLAIEASFGLATVAECRGNLDDAAAWYDKARNRALDTSFPKLADLASARTDALPELATPVVLISQAELYVPPPPVIPDPEPIVVPPEDLEVGPTPGDEQPPDQSTDQPTDQPATGPTQAEPSSDQPQDPESPTAEPSSDEPSSPPPADPAPADPAPTDPAPTDPPPAGDPPPSP